MALYIRFIASLAVGLMGLGCVLKIVMDELLVEWDAFAAFVQWVTDLWSGKGLQRHQRTEDMLLEIEKAKTTEIGGLRLIDQRREQLRELASVERRLQAPPRSGPIVLTPLPPVPVSLASPAAK